MATTIRRFGTLRPGKKPGTYRVGIELKPGQKIKIGDIVLTYKKPSSPGARAYQTVTLPNKRSALNFLKEAEKQLLGGKTKLSVEQTAKLFKNKPKNQNFDEFVQSLNKKYVDTYGREINNEQVRNNLLKSGLKGAGVAFEPLTKAKQRELIETYPSLYKSGYDFKKYKVGISPEVAGNYYDELYSKAKDVSKRWPGGGDSSKNRVWQGAYRSVITGENFNKPRYKLFDVNKNRVLTPGEVDRTNWAKKYKQAVFFDTETGKKFSYDGKIKGTISLENYLNKYAVPGDPNPNRFKESVGKYDLTRKIRNIKFNAPSGKTITLGGYLDSKFRPKTLTGRAAFGSFNNHHFRDLTKNFWDTDIVFYKDNAQLNYFERPTRQALTEAAKLSGKEQDKFLKPFEKQIKQLGPIRMLEGNIELGKYNLEDALTRTFKAARIPKGTQNFLFDEINLFDEIGKLNPTDLKKVCRIVSSKDTGGSVTTCAQAIASLKSNPENIAKLETMTPTSAALGKVKNAATSFLKFAGKGKVFAATTAVGVGAGALVKKFMSDDPSTYLTNDAQANAMILDTIDQKEREERMEAMGDAPELLDEAAIGAEVGAMGAAIPGASAVYQARKKPFTRIVDGVKKTRPAMGTARAALGPVGKALSGFATPAGIAAITPLNVASSLYEGDSAYEVATDPVNYLGPAFAGKLSQEATRGMGATSKLARSLRLGMSPGAIKMVSRRFGIPGLALSAGISLYELADDYKMKRGLFGKKE